MELTKEIISIISALVTLIITLTPLIIVIIKKCKKIKQVIEIAIKEKNWNSVLKILPEIIQEAELFIKCSGNEKKQYVLDKIENISLANNFEFDIDKCGKEIDTLVQLTKKVNQREKDKSIH